MGIGTAWRFVWKEGMGGTKTIEKRGRFLALFYTSELPLPSSYYPYKIQIHGHKKTTQVWGLLAELAVTKSQGIFLLGNCRTVSQIITEEIEVQRGKRLSSWGEEDENMTANIYKGESLYSTLEGQHVLSLTDKLDHWNSKISSNLPL